MTLMQTRLEELQLIQCSLLPGESMEFIQDEEFWSRVLSQNIGIDFDELSIQKQATMATFTLKVDGKPVWLQVTMFMTTDDDLISVKGDNLSRGEQERWLEIAKEKREELEDTEFLLCNLLSLHLVPLLHEAPLEKPSESESTSDSRQESAQPEPASPHHVLFTSHHLVSSKKRRSLQQWSSSLKLAGFAKVGYPGVIYAQGKEEDIEEFVSNVKAMQWLALKVRFAERVPESMLNDTPGGGSLSGWQEFSRVGEVVEEMRRIGREDRVLEMGIGSSTSG